MAFFILFFYILVLVTLVFVDWRRKWQSIPVFLPGKFHGQRSPTDCSLWNRKELDMTEQLSTAYFYYFSEKAIIFKSF